MLGQLSDLMPGWLGVVGLFALVAPASVSVTGWLLGRRVPVSIGRLVGIYYGIAAALIALAILASAVAGPIVVIGVACLAVCGVPLAMAVLVGANPKPGDDSGDSTK